MTSKKPVRARIVFAETMPTPEQSPSGMRHLDVVSTFNMTERAFLDRQPDMLVEDEDSNRFRIIKSLVAFIKEIKVVSQKVEEVE